MHEEMSDRELLEKAIEKIAELRLHIKRLLAEIRVLRIKHGDNEAINMKEAEIVINDIREFESFLRIMKAGYKGDTI